VLPSDMDACSPLSAKDRHGRGHAAAGGTQGHPQVAPEKAPGWTMTATRVTARPALALLAWPPPVIETAAGTLDASRRTTRRAWRPSVGGAVKVRNRGATEITWMTMLADPMRPRESRARSVIRRRPGASPAVATATPSPTVFEPTSHVSRWPVNRWLVSSNVCPAGRSSRDLEDHATACPVFDAFVGTRDVL
jgi:hypothetical protein